MTAAINPEIDETEAVEAEQSEHPDWMAEVGDIAQFLAEMVDDELIDAGDDE